MSDERARGGSTIRAHLLVGGQVAELPPQVRDGLASDNIAVAEDIEDGVPAVRAIL